MSEADARQMMSLLRSRRFHLSDEKETQQQIADELTAAGIIHEREFRLDARNIIDFMSGDIGIEIKLKGGRLSIYRQLERYAEFEAVKRLILVSNVPMGLPPHLNGKPTHFVNLGKAWL